jgi:hypothetical protein
MQTTSRTKSTSKRQIIQIALNRREIYALCSDGTLWCHPTPIPYGVAEMESDDWQQLKNVPQTKL